MDFLGLKTLSIIKDALSFIKESKGIDLNIDTIPLDDKKTFNLYSKGETTALFQFESPGMKKHLRALQPNRFEDLIAMNALYRPGPMDPGPMEYIPSFINRKHGREKIEFDIPEMEEYLMDTYGITVYQEQVMLLSQKLAGFTKGQADGLRKAMGKKQIKVMNELKEKFTKGCLNNGHPQEAIDKIWNDWEAFAQYAFNKSHSTCYAYISYQTAYLKANFPSEFMAAVLGRNISDLKKITIFMDECKRMGIQVLGPDVNESIYKFTVNASGDIRFGLGAIKGVGENAVANIIEVRKEKGKFKDIFDFTEKVNLQTVSKKNFETLAVAGAFDSMGSIKRSEYYALDQKGISFIEQIMRYGAKVQSEKNNNQQSLFGANTGFDLQKPEVPKAEDWSKLEKLIDNFCNTTLTEMNDLPSINGKDATIAGMVTTAKVAMTKTGKYFGKINLEDYSDSWELALFGKDFENFRKYCFEGYSLLIKGKVQPKSYNPSELEFKIRSMHMLTDVKEEMIKMVNITIPIHEITENLVDEIKKQVEANKGKIQLKFRVVDPESKISIDLFSRTLKVNLSPKFLNYLKSNEFDFRVKE